MRDGIVGSMVVLTAYCVGCLTAGYYLVRLQTGADLRATHTGTVGARNAGRVLGRRGFALTFLLDAAKGAAAVALARAAGEQDWAAAALAAVVTGHIWPAQLRFHGGKGLATALGAMLVFDWRVTLIVVGIAAVILAVARHFTLAGMLGTATAPVLAAAMGGTAVSVAGIATAAALVIRAHRANIRVIPAELRARRVRQPAT